MRFRPFPNASANGRSRQPASPTRPRPARKPGTPEKGIEIVLDVEMLLYEATTLLNGASLINRCAKS